MPKHSKLVDSDEALIPEAKLITQILRILKGVLSVATKIVKLSK